MKNGTRQSGRPVKVHVSAFGKHPGWDDHIEEIGLDCPQLVRAKRVLYTECIGGNIDSGEWEKLEEGKRLPFRHEFVWSMPDGVMVGRLWASRDGKGRTKYPMVLCVFLEHAPLDWACAQVLPRLAQVEADCTQTNSAELVRFAIGGCQRELEKAAEAFNAAPPPEEGVGDLVSRLVSAPALAGGGREGMVRVLYEMGRELTEFTRSHQSTIKSKDYEPACAHLRVPRGLPGPGEGARAWVRVMEQDILPGFPVLVLAPVGEPFVDVLVGEPKLKAFFCARAGAGALGLASDVPYTMEESEVARHQARLESWASGGAQARRSGAVAAVAAGMSRESRLKLGLLALAGVLLIAIVIAVSSRKKPAGPESTEAATNQSPAPAPNVETPRPPEPPATVGNSAPPASSEADPRLSWEVGGAISRVRADLDRLDAELKDEGSAPVEEQRQKLADLERRADLVRAMPWRPSSRDQIVRDVQTLDEQVAGVKKEVDAGLEAAYGRVSAMVQQRTQNAPVSDPVLLAGWRTGVAAIDPKAGRVAALQKMDAMAKDLKAAEEQLAIAPIAPAPEVRLVDGGLWSKVATDRKARAAREAADAAVGGDSARVKDALDRLKAWNQDAGTVAAKAQQLAGVLAAGQVLSADAKPSAREIEAAMQSSPAYADLGPAVRPLLDQIEAVRGVGSLSAPDALIAAIKGGAGDPSRAPGVVAAWSRLVEVGWPRIPADLIEASQLSKAEMASAVGGVADAGQRSALAAQAAEAGRAMWSRFVTTSAGNEAGAEAALAGMQGLGIGDEQLARLPDWARYNLLLAQFRAGVRGATQGSTLDQPTRDAVARFVVGVEALGATTQQRPEVNELLKGLRPLREVGAGLEFSKLGPGKAGWTAGAPDADGGVTYSLVRPGSSHSLHFRRVTAGGSDVTFMSTTEVSVGQFIDVVRGANKWGDIKPHLVNYGATGDTRRGPRVWEWSTAAGETMRVVKPGKDDFSKGWLRPKASMSGREYYAQGLTVEAPTPDMPMQYVSPTAAVVFARMMGCRLPTSKEWKRAVPEQGEAAPNLRDATWAKQFEQTKSLLEQAEVKRDPPDFPGAGAFWPSGVTRPSPNQDGTPAVDSSDGLLWFAPVGAGSRFQHLTGNVAEYVWEDPTGMEGLEANPVKVMPYLGGADKLRVIGGSALSAREVPVDQPLPVKLTQAREGYADVGFRLAFSAPQGAGSGSGAAGQSLAALVQGATYLPAEK